MNEKLSTIASISVIALVLYALWLLKDVSKSDIQALINTLNSVSKTFGTPVAETKDETRYYVWGGIIVLFGLTAYTLKKR